MFTRRERHRVDYLEAEIKRETAGLKERTGETGKRRQDAEQRLRGLKAELTAIRKNARKTMISVPIKPRTIRLLPRGNWLDDSGPVMKPEIPEFLGKLTVGERGGVSPPVTPRNRKADASRSPRRPNRLDLANWLTSRKNGVGGMTARVMVNRLWYLYFGVGIAKILDDFGGQGEPPTHPELLDNLAMEFIDSGWNADSHKTNPQSSIPNPQSFARQSRFRLPAEMIRDNALAVSGLLVRRLGGASVKPYQPAGYYRHLNFPKRKYKPHLDDRQWRRGVYVHWQRQFLHPMLKAFDAPSREECTAQRPRSNTPIAAMTLLNDPTFLESARVFAARILQTGGKTTDARLSYAFRLAVSHKPDAFERKVLTGLLASQRRYFKANPKEADKLLATGIAPTPSNIDRIELAAWTAVARAILNLNETITRN